jgi:hypothetical protein
MAEAGVSLGCRDIASVSKERVIWWGEVGGLGG